MGAQDRILPIAKIFLVAISLTLSSINLEKETGKILKLERYSQKILFKDVSVETFKIFQNLHQQSMPLNCDVTVAQWLTVRETNKDKYFWRRANVVESSAPVGQNKHDCNS